MLIYRLFSALVGYVFGCFLTAEVVVKVKTGSRVSGLGTGNPGMANVMANLGKGPGFAVLAGDLTKTFLASLVAWFLFSPKIGYMAVLYGGFGALLGHNYPFWRRFQGGKGVAVTCAWLTVSFGWQGLLCCAIGGVVVLCTGWLPLGAVVIPALGIPVAFWKRGAEGGILAVLVFVIMLLRHRHGLWRIRNGTESTHLKVTGKKKN